jgi:pimeloyl-ACP methyl ester carboxylesterase
VDVEFTPFHRGGSGPPLVLLHGFTDTWRTWELSLPSLERRFDVLAPTLPGHAGGPPLPELDERVMVDAVERAMDDAGLETAHVAGNSLGGFVALQLAARGRARSVTALAPAGGWAPDDASYREMLHQFVELHELAQTAAPFVDELVADEEIRRQATEVIVERYEHIPPELVAHLIVGVAGCAVEPLIEYALDTAWQLDAERIACPVRLVWGTADRALPLPSGAVRFRQEWLPQAEWVELDGVGHCPQLDVPLETAELIAGFAT